MTKEELEKEAEKYADTVKCEWENDTYWVDCRDKVTDAYLASAEPREKRIAELEATNKRISNECHTLVDTLEKKQKEITELEKENAELKEKSKRQSKNYKCDVDKLLEENAELKEKNKWLEDCKLELADFLGKANDKIANLEKENAELKKMYHESDEDNNKLRENIPILAEAKEIIKTFLAIANNDVEYVQNPQDCKDLWKELCENAKQFIKDSEVEK